MNTNQEIFTEDDGKVWGPLRSGPTLREIIERKKEWLVPLYSWKTTERPTADNIHPDEAEATCDCDHYCLDCGELREDGCNYCSDCDTHDCDCR